MPDGDTRAGHISRQSSVLIFCVVLSRARVVEQHTQWETFNIDLVDWCVVRWLYKHKYKRFGIIITDAAYTDIGK